MLRRHFNDQQSSMLGDHIEGAMLVSYNHRNLSPKRVIVGEPGKWLYLVLVSQFGVGESA